MSAIGFKCAARADQDDEDEGEDADEPMQVGEGHHEHTPDFVKSALELRAAGARYVKMGQCEVSFYKRKGE